MSWSLCLETNEAKVCREQILANRGLGKVVRRMGGMVGRVAKAKNNDHEVWEVGRIVDGGIVLRMWVSAWGRLAGG